MEYLSLHENRQYDPVHSRQVEHQQRLSERPVGSMISAVSVSMLVTGPHKFFPRHLVLAQWRFGTHSPMTKQTGSPSSSPPYLVLNHMEVPLGDIFIVPVVLV